MAKTNAKTKKKKSVLSAVRKDAIKKKSMNPFEVHVNKQKYEVLGRKVKHDRGLPGVARAKAMKKRKSTLLQEYREKDKSNTFMDKRIGEKNRAMTGEDRIMARFTAEKMKAHNKKSKFNLADDEVLTHHGQTLSELEKFDDPRSEDEDEADEGKLDASFVKEAHFGGGIFTKSGNPQSRKDLIEQLIAESKKRKWDQKKNREQTQELTDKLDTEWKDLLPIISTSKRNKDTVEAIERPDEYDTMMRELKFEARGKPTDRLKAEDEIAREEKESLEKLEADRLQRMHGITPTDKPKPTHRSADDLDDGFAIESDEEEQEELSYDVDGKLRQAQVQPLDEEMQSDQENSNAEDSDAEEKLVDDEGDETEDSEEDFADMKSDSEVEEKKESESEDMEAETTTKNVPVEQESVKQAMKTLSNSVTKQGVKETNLETADDNLKKLEDVENIKKDLAARKVIMEAARKELPFTYKVPECYEELQKLLLKQSPEYQSVILERIIKCNHPSLADGNKEKLATLLAFLLQHLHETATQEEGKCLLVLDRLAPHIYDVAIMSTGNARRCIAEVLREKQSDYRNQQKEFPAVDTLVFLKLVSLLFPTSDFRHPVVTPAFVFMGQLLDECHVKTRRDVAVGLFLSTLILEYTVLSKRFCPEVINFLGKLLQLASSSSKGPGDSKLMEIPTSYVPPVNVSLLKLKELTNESPIDDLFRYQALSQAIRLLTEFYSNLSDLPAAFEVFSSLTQIKSKKLPQELRSQVESLQKCVNEIKSRKMPRLVPEAKKPKALKLYEPKVEKVFDGRKHRVTSKDRQEREKLLHKVKRETKGAIREIRRDQAFIAKLRTKQTRMSDMERKAKVREIYGSASTQQGELNALARKKK